MTSCWNILYLGIAFFFCCFLSHLLCWNKFSTKMIKIQKKNVSNNTNFWLFGLYYYVFNTKRSSINKGYIICFLQSFSSCYHDSPDTHFFTVSVNPSCVYVYDGCLYGKDVTMDIINWLILCRLEIQGTRVRHFQCRSHNVDCRMSLFSNLVCYIKSRWL